MPTHIKTTPYLLTTTIWRLTMGLSNAKEEQLKSMPKLEFITRKSKDGKYIIHKTVITDIKPTAYYEKVLSSEEVTDEVMTELEGEVSNAKA
jgi:hypothetical protein